MPGCHPRMGDDIGPGPPEALDARTAIVEGTRRPQMALGVHSEIGKLRKVMVHRPGLEHTRLTPSNAEDLLFDDVLWVSRAKAEHDMFCEAMRERGVEVFEAEQLLAEALTTPEAMDFICDHVLSELAVGITTSQRARDWARTADPVQVADFLIGGISKADVQQDAGLVW